MSKRASKWIVQAVAGILIGLALGVAIGWWLWPVEYTNTTPDVLRQDYANDYVVMVATAYAVEGDLTRAYERLALLDSTNPTTPVVRLAERLIETGGRDEDITRLARLAQALGVLTPPLTSYLEDQP